MFLRHFKIVDNREKVHITEHYPAMRAGSDGGVWKFRKRMLSRQWAKRCWLLRGRVVPLRIRLGKIRLFSKIYKELASSAMKEVNKR